MLPVHLHLVEPAWQLRGDDAFHPTRLVRAHRRIDCKPVKGSDPFTLRVRPDSLNFLTIATRHDTTR
jgi:hypothetical protein